MGEIKGTIYSIQHYCIHDGPGIRTTVFFKGCQLRCPWCANPESQSIRLELGFYEHKCTNCKICFGKCPQRALDSRLPGRIDRTKCTMCGLCERYCAKECYQIFGEEMTAEKLLEEVEKDIPFYRNSGGGVTVSGGEPTLQADFLLKFLTLCKQDGLDTALESHAHAEKEVFRKLAGCVDHFLLDIKHMDSRKHEDAVGVPNIKILRNIQMLGEEYKSDVSIRMPFIPGFNDTKDNIILLGEFAKHIQENGRLTMVHLLPYHNLGKSKYQALARAYEMDRTAIPDNSILEYWKTFLGTKYGIPVTIGG